MEKQGLNMAFSAEFEKYLSDRKLDNKMAVKAALEDVRVLTNDLNRTVKDFDKEIKTLTGIDKKNKQEEKKEFIENKRTEIANRNKERDKEIANRNKEIQARKDKLAGKKPVEEVEEVEEVTETIKETTPSPSPVINPNLLAEYEKTQAEVLALEKEVADLGTGSFMGAAAEARLTITRNKLNNLNNRISAVENLTDLNKTGLNPSQAMELASLNEIVNAPPPTSLGELGDYTRQMDAAQEQIAYLRDIGADQNKQNYLNENAVAIQAALEKQALAETSLPVQMSMAPPTGIMAFNPMAAQPDYAAMYNAAVQNQGLPAGLMQAPTSAEMGATVIDAGGGLGRRPMPLSPGQIAAIRGRMIANPNRGIMQEDISETETTIS